MNSITRKKNNPVVKFFPEAGLIVLFVAFHWYFLNLDFWNDEIYTFKKFVLQDYSVILTDYHVPNNHIFFNLINKLYFDLIGIENLNDVLISPWRIRILPLIYAIVSLIFIFKICNRFLTRETGWLTAGLLITTVPYSNFVLQMRGYGLSMMLLIMLVYFLLNYLNSARRLNWVGVMITAFLVFYTIPSNLYALLSVLFFLGVFCLIDIFHRKETSKSTFLNILSGSRYFKLMIAVLTGAAIALICYVPIFNEVFKNDYVKPGEAFQLDRLTHYSKAISEGILSYRWVILPFVAAGFLLGYKFLNKPDYLLLLACFTLVPVLLVFFRGDKAPLRVFAVFLPFYAGLMSFAVMAFLIRFEKIKKLIPLTVLAMLSYSVMVAYQEHVRNEAKISSDLIENRRAQNFYHHYYSYCFQPMEDVRLFHKNHYNKNIPVVIVGCETHDIPHYLDFFEIPYYDSFDLDSLKSTNNTLHLVTNHPFEFANDSLFDMIPLKRDLTYHTFVRFSRKAE